MKFRVEVVREDDYIIEIDPEVWTVEALEEHSKIFGSVEDLEELSEEIAFQIMRFGYYDFLEGFGYLNAQIHNSPFERTPPKGSAFCKGIKVTVITHDEDYVYHQKDV